MHTKSESNGSGDSKAGNASARLPPATEQEKRQIDLFLRRLQQGSMALVERIDKGGEVSYSKAFMGIREWHVSVIRVLAWGIKINSQRRTKDAAAHSHRSKRAGRNRDAGEPSRKT